MATKKIRVYELARELGVENQVVLDLCERLKIGVKSHSSSIDDPLADRVRRLADAEGLRREPTVEEPVVEAPPAEKPSRAVRSTKPAPEPATEPVVAPAVEPVAASAATATTTATPTDVELAPAAQVDLEPAAAAEPAHRVVRSTGVIPDPTLAPRPAPAPAPVERPAAAEAAPAPAASAPRAGPGRPRDAAHERDRTSDPAASGWWTTHSSASRPPHRTRLAGRAAYRVAAPARPDRVAAAVVAASRRDPAVAAAVVAAAVAAAASTAAVPVRAPAAPVVDAAAPVAAAARVAVVPRGAYRPAGSAPEAAQASSSRLRRPRSGFDAAAHPE